MSRKALRCVALRRKASSLSVQVVENTLYNKLQAGLPTDNDSQAANRSHRILSYVSALKTISPKCQVSPQSKRDASKWGSQNRRPEGRLRHPQLQLNASQRPTNVKLREICSYGSSHSLTQSIREADNMSLFPLSNLLLAGLEHTSLFTAPACCFLKVEEAAHTARLD